MNQKKFVLIIFKYFPYGGAQRDLLQLAKKFCPEVSGVLEKTAVGKFAKSWPVPPKEPEISKKFSEGGFRLKLRKFGRLITIPEGKEMEIFSLPRSKSSSPLSIGSAASPVPAKEIELSIGPREETVNERKAVDSLSNVAKTLAEIIGAGFAGVNKAVPTGYAERAVAGEGSKVKGCSIS